LKEPLFAEPSEPLEKVAMQSREKKNPAAACAVRKSNRSLQRASSRAARRDAAREPIREITSCARL